MIRMTRTACLAAALAALPVAALAHPGHGQESGFAAGLGHPLGGLDHVAVMIAVGLLAARLGGRALWLLPASFLTLMTIGGALDMAGVTAPITEAMIGLSLVVMLTALILRWTPPLPAMACMIGAFALLHGLAHGAEAPSSASGLAFAGGFILATALLHGLGLTAGLLLSRRRAMQRSR
ncbi:urease accessory protein [Caulobacter ginsengisoli]|uniref:Urease accessory protein n=1 Tax=Caulobacter ginsengisoli TaxID=400775 RepID=A0ABU0IXI6_9CAUL|nr:HupE/UreJ family protein [Caulobacter ginsengisoli]MDQ0466717.1 urease accessory protein [Caulobacter ginsengisoli]